MKVSFSSHCSSLLDPPHFKLGVLCPSLAGSDDTQLLFGLSATQPTYLLLIIGKFNSTAGDGVQEEPVKPREVAIHLQTRGVCLTRPWAGYTRRVSPGTQGRFTLHPARVWAAGSCGQAPSPNSQLCGQSSAGKQCHRCKVPIPREVGDLVWSNTVSETTNGKNLRQSKGFLALQRTQNTQQARTHTG